MLRVVLVIVVALASRSSIASADEHAPNSSDAARAASESVPSPERLRELQLDGEATPVAPGIVSSEFTEIRAAESPDGKMILWGSTNRPGGPGGWNIWLSRRGAGGWSAPEPVPFNSEANDFDPAFAPDSRWVYFFSNRPGGLGGDDIYRVAVAGERFGPVEHLGSEVNSAGDEWAPALSPDGAVLLFASDGRGGHGRHDLFAARAKGARWTTAAPLPGALNTSADEFDATFLADGTSVVFTRSANVESERVTLFYAARSRAGYEVGKPLPLTGKLRDVEALGPTMSWHDTAVLFFSAAAADAASKRPDIYQIRYRLR